MRLAITHEITFRFDTPAKRAIQTVRLTPRNTESQLVHDWRIDVSQDCRLSPVEDAFGNLTHTFSIDGPIDELSIVATGLVVTEDTAGILHATHDRLPLTVFCRETERTAADGAVRALAAEIAAGSSEPLSRMHALMRLLDERITVVPDAPVRTPDEVLATDAATVEDLSHLFAAVARMLHIPTRCVAGYLRSEDGAPTAARHAWNEMHLGPLLGWVAFDAAENSCPTDLWVRTAVGLDALDTLPIRCVPTGGDIAEVTTRIVVRDTGRA